MHQISVDDSSGTVKVVVDGVIYTPLQAPPPPPPPPPPNTLSQRLGFSPGAPMVLAGHDVGADLGVVKTSGVGWLRLDCFDSGNAILDGVVKASVAAGIQVLMIINANYTGTPSAYASTCSLVTKRYAALGVHAFELVNEPNLGPKISLTAYLALLGPAISAVRAADPTAKILAGCLSPAGNSVTDPNSPVTWGKAIVDSGAKYDILSIHPYCSDGGTLPNVDAGWSTWTRMKTLHDYMASKGDTRPIWATEFGGPIDSTHWTEAQQVSGFQQAAAFMLVNPWLEKLFWFCIRDGANGFGSYGVVRGDGVARPVLAAMVAATR